MMAMLITPLTVGLLSGLMIAAGVILVARDVRRGRRVPVSWQTDKAPATAMVQTPVGSLPAGLGDDPDSEVTIVRHDTVAAPVAMTSPAQVVQAALSHLTTPQTARPAASRSIDGTAFADLQAAIAGIRAEAQGVSDDTGIDAPRDPAIERWFASVTPALTASVGQINSALAPVKCRVGEFGEIGWSFRNKGYGGYRRVWIEDASVAWLRIELHHDGQLEMRLRAHKDEQAVMNATTALPANRTSSAELVDALSGCLRPVAAYAAWIVPKHAADADAAREAWGEIAPVVQEALELSNGALSEAAARLTPRGQADWDQAAHCQRITFDIEVAGVETALMQIDVAPRTLDVAVGVPDPNLIDLARRQRIDIAGLTSHGLAEAMASCAWPAIANAVATAEMALQQSRAVAPGPQRAQI